MSTITRMKPNQRLSAINICNGFVYLAGQTGNAAGTLQDQARTVLGKVDALLEEAGSSREHMLSVTVYLRDMKDFAAFNEVYEAWIPRDNKPARACVEARLAQEGLLCEAVVVAVQK